MACDSIFSFPAVVNGQRMTAAVVSEEGEGRDFHYRVQFSDGYEEVFNVKDGKLIGLAGHDSDPYAEAIKYDVGHYIGFNPEKFWYVFDDLLEGETLNVWIFEEEEEDEEENIETSYNVFVKKEYRFHLVRVGDRWMLSNKYDNPLSNDDHTLAQKVEDLLIALL